MACNTCGDVGETCARSDAIAVAAVDAQDWNLLTRVVGTGPCRIAAVIGGDDQEVVVIQDVQQFGQSRIEVLQRLRIAGYVPAMAVQGVEVDEIGEQQAAIVKLVQSIQHGREQGPVAVAFEIAAGASMSENVV